MPEKFWEYYGDNPSTEQALGTLDKATEETSVTQRSVAYDDFRNVHSRTDVRSGFTRDHYNYYRNKELIPTKPKDIIKSCMDAYCHVGLLKNTIDLMADFAVQGIRLVHPNPRIEEFYQNWFNNKVKGADRSERLLNLFYRAGNVIILRQTAKIARKKATKLMKTQADPDLTNVKQESITGRSEIPFGYNILNPLMIENISDPVGSFFGVPTWGLRLPTRVKDSLGKSSIEYLKTLPESVRSAIANKKDIIPLPGDKVVSYHYKKDDWDVWAKPMIYSILDDILALEKGKLADLAALDGAISKIRVWKLGNLDHKIMPTDAGVAKLAGLLNNNVGGGVMDLIWGPAIELIESSSDIHQFLGMTKYIPILTNIQMGLGIPPMMGADGGKEGMTNNFLSLKTLIERLEYGRRILEDFWNREIALVQKAYGFARPAQVVFDHMILSDESSEKALYIQLWDRGLVSDERIRERFGESALMEAVRIRREEKDRESGKVPPRSGPYFNPDKDHDLKKIALQSGQATPGQVGVELAEQPPGEKKVIDIQAAQQAEKKKQQGVSGQGRPQNSKDSRKRKQKVTKPITNKTNANLVDLVQWANKAQDRVSELVNPAILKSFGRDNFRKCTDEEIAAAEKKKLFIFAAIPPFEELSKEVVLKAVRAGQNKEFANIYFPLLDEFIATNGRRPKVDELKELKTKAYIHMTVKEI